MFIIQEMLETYTREDNDYLRLRLALDDLGSPYEIVSYDNDGNLRLLDADFCPINDNSRLSKLLSMPFIPKGSVKLTGDLGHYESNLLRQPFPVDYYSFFDKIPKEYFLNNPEQIGPLRNLQATENEFLLRPMKDSKSIPGRIITKEEFLELKNNYIHFPNYEEIESQEYMIAAKKNLRNEYRFFIVNNNISTYSSYVNNYKYSPSTSVPINIVDFANYIVNTYSMIPNVVLDIGELNTGELFIIEYNDLSCSGLYDCDERKLLVDLSKLMIKWIDK